MPSQACQGFWISFRVLSPLWVLASSSGQTCCPMLEIFGSECTCCPWPFFLALLLCLCVVILVAVTSWPFPVSFQSHCTFFFFNSCSVSHQRTETDLCVCVLPRFDVLLYNLKLKLGWIHHQCQNSCDKCPQVDLLNFCNFIFTVVSHGERNDMRKNDPVHHL